MYNSAVADFSVVEEYRSDLSSLSQFSHVRGTKWRRGCSTRLQLHVTWKYDYASELVHPIHVGACSCVTTRDRRLPREEAESRGRDGRSSTLWAPFLAASPSSLCGRLHLSFLPLPPFLLIALLIPIVSFPREISAAINSAAADRSLE